MPDKIKINFQGQEAWGERVPVQQSNEIWNQYLLADGAMIKMKTVVTEVVRIENQYDQEGNPVYAVKSANVLSVIAPEELKRQS